MVHEMLDEVDEFDLHSLFLNQMEVGELGEDPLALSSKHIQCLNQKQAMEELSSLKEVRGFTAYYLGGVLSLARDNQWYKDLGYTGFTSFLEDYVGISSSAGYDYMHIYHGLSGSGISWKKVKHIGWTKIRHFARYLEPDNVDEWIKAAEQRNVTQLREFVKKVIKQGHIELLSSSNPLISKHVETVKAKAKPEKVSTHVEGLDTDLTQKEEKDEEGPVGSKNANLDKKPKLITKEAAEQTPISRTFKLYPDQIELVDQALEYAQQEGETNSNSLALYYVCMHYLTSQGGAVDS